MRSLIIIALTIGCLLDANASTVTISAVDSSGNTITSGSVVCIGDTITFTASDSESKEVTLTVTGAQALDPITGTKTGTPSVTVQVKANNSGESKISAVATSSGGTASMSVHVIDITGMKYKDHNGDFQQCPPTLYICKGDTVVLKAIATPDKPFPSGEPVWTGPGTANGDEYTDTYNDLGSTFVTATCGEATFTQNIFVVEAERIEYSVDGGSLKPAGAEIVVCQGTEVMFYVSVLPGPDNGIPVGVDATWNLDGVEKARGEKTYTETFSTASNDAKVVTFVCSKTLTVNVFVIEIDKIQYKNKAGAFVDCPQVLWVCNGEDVTFKAVAKPNKNFPEDHPEWIDGAAGMGNPVTATINGRTTITAKCGTSLKSVEAHGVDLDELQYRDHLGNWVKAENTLTVCKFDSVNFRVLLNPANAEAPEHLIWKLDNFVLAEGVKEVSAVFPITSNDLGDLRTVSVACGGMSLSAKVLVVELDRVEGPTNICRGESGLFTAFARPAGASFPPGKPTWTGLASSPSNDGLKTVSVTFPDTSQSSTDFKIVEAICGDAKQARVLVHSVSFVSPVEADFFTPDRVGRIMISTLQGGGYHTHLQNADHQVLCTAHLFPPAPGFEITFEVIDPDDASTYDEDSNPDTIYSFPTAGHNIEAPAPNNDPNDNRDPLLHLRGGTIATYNSFQGAALSSRTASTNAQGEATVTLTTTNRFAGDNYVVRATCRHVGAQPFNADSGVVAPASHAGLDSIDVGQSMTLTAWKRVYYEQDEMYRVGSPLTVVTHAGSTVVRVRNAAVFAVGNQVRVFDDLGREPALFTIRSIRPTGNGTALLELNGALTRNFRPGPRGFVGVETGVRAADFFVPDTSRLHETFDDAYIELMMLAAGSTGVPLEDSPNLLNFTDRWFNNKRERGRNYLYLVGSRFDAASDGLSNCQFNFSFVFIRPAIGGADHPPAKIRDIVNHELVHQWQLRTGPGGQGHDTDRAHDNRDQCLMDDRFPRNGVAGRNDMNDTHELAVDHLYRLRDFTDDL